MVDTNYNMPPVIVCGLCSTGLSVLRNLSNYGIPLIGIGSNTKGIGFYSKYGRKFVCPDVILEEEHFLEFILRLGSTLDKKGVLFPTADQYVLFISKYREELKTYFNFALPEDNIIRKIVSKEGLVDIAKSTNTPCPRTYFPQDISELKELSKKIGYPCIIKPDFAYTWHNGKIHEITKGEKVIKIYTSAELVEVYKKLAAVEKRMIIQEIIPGLDNNLYYFASYLNKKSEPLGIFAGRKHRILPVHFGSGTLVESVYDKELAELCLYILKSCKYHGLCGVEVKRDIRDDVYKLIEINARFGLWDALGKSCGVDLAYIAYKDIIGENSDKVIMYRTDVKWIDFHRDLKAFLIYKSEGLITFKEWILSLKGEKQWAIFSIRDMKPFIYALQIMFKGILRYMFQRIYKKNIF